MTIVGSILLVIAGFLVYKTAIRRSFNLSEFSIEQGNARPGKFYISHYPRIILRTDNSWENNSNTTLLIKYFPSREEAIQWLEKNKPIVTV